MEVESRRVRAAYKMGAMFFTIALMKNMIVWSFVEAVGRGCAGGGRRGIVRNGCGGCRNPSPCLYRTHTFFTAVFLFLRRFKENSPNRIA